MARTITIDLRDFAGQVAGEVVGGEAHVTIWAPTFRPAVTGAWVVGPQPESYYFADGKVSIPNVEPGPIVMQFHVRQFDGEDTFNLNVPDGDGEIDLRTLMVEDFEYAPIVITEAQRVLREAQDVLKHATATRESLGPALKEAEQSLAKSVSDAKTQINTARASLDTKVQEASAALAKDAAANLAAAKAAVEQVVANNKASLDAQAAAAQSARTAADTSKAEAETHRKAAESAASRAATAVLTIETTLASKADAQHRHAISDVTNLQLTLDGKAAKAHSHTIGDVTGLQPALDGKAASSHTHTLAQISNAPNSHTSAATAGTLASRDSAGRLQVAAPSVAADAANKQYVDAEVGKKANTSHTHTSAQISDAVNTTGTSTAASKVVTAGTDGFIHTSVNPTAANHLARKAYVDAHISSLNTSVDGKAPTVHTHTSDQISDATENAGSTSGNGNRVVRTAADGRLFISTDSITSAGHATNKAYVDTAVGKKANTSHTHTLAQISNAPNSHTSAATAGTLASRDSAGRLQVAAPSVAADAANKQYVDAEVAKKANTSHTHEPTDIVNIKGRSNTIGRAEDADKLIHPNSTGWTFIAADPTTGNHPTRKSYVDGLVNNTIKSDWGLTKLGTENLDTLTEQARYYQSSNANATTDRKYPAALAGVLEVTQIESFVYQRYTTYSSNMRVYVRGKYNTAWSAWRELSDTGHSHSWGDITGKPSTFAPASHSHAWGDITGKPSTFAPATHSHAWGDITGKPSTFAPASHSHAWGDITGKPSTFAPSSHTHALSQISGVPNSAVHGATASTLMVRDANGRSQVQDPTVALEIANKQYVDQTVSASPINVISTHTLTANGSPAIKLYRSGIFMFVHVQGRVSKVTWNISDSNFIPSYTQVIALSGTETKYNARMEITKEGRAQVKEESTVADPFIMGTGVMLMDW